MGRINNDYPQLKNITVIRKDVGVFVVVNKPYDGPSFESMLGHSGRPRKIFNNPQTIYASAVPKQFAGNSGSDRGRQDTSFVFKPTPNELGLLTTSWGQVRLRPVQESDAVEIMAIYAPYVLHTAVSFENDVPSVAEMVSRIRARAGRYPYIVAETVPQNDHEVPHLLGYAYASAFHEREAYHYCAETSIYIDQLYQRDGLGRALYSCLELVLRLQGFTNLYACIAYNEALAMHLQDFDPYLTLDSVHFHKRMGYRINGVFHRCGYKFGRWFDMCWMEKLLEPLSNPVSPCESLLSCEEAYARLAQL